MAWPPCKSWRDCHTRECVGREAALADLDRLPGRVGGRGDGDDRARRSNVVDVGGLPVRRDRDLLANIKTAAGADRLPRRLRGRADRDDRGRGRVGDVGGLTVRRERSRLTYITTPPHTARIRRR